MSQQRMALGFRESFVTYRVILVSIGLVGVGIGLLIFSASQSAPPSTSMRVLNSIGETLVAAGTISFGWDLIAKKSFAKEIFEIANLSENLRNSGISAVHESFGDLWSAQLKATASIRLFVGYAGSWRGTHNTELTRIARLGPGRLEVYLPDFNNDTAMSALAHRYDMNIDSIKSKVTLAATEFYAMDPGNVHVYLFPGDLTHSMYILNDSKGYLALYPHSKERQPVPTFEVGPGALFEFMQREFGNIKDASIRFTGEES